MLFQVDSSLPRVPVDQRFCRFDNFPCVINVRPFFKIVFVLVNFDFTANIKPRIQPNWIKYSIKYIFHKIVLNFYLKASNGSLLTSASGRKYFKSNFGSLVKEI